MEFGKHLGRGLWALADKTLPAIYGLGFIFLVIRVLPEHEYGAFVLVQSVFTIATVLAFAFALQPMTKLVAETDEPGPYLLAGLVLQTLFLMIVSILSVVFKAPLVELLDPKHQVDLSPLLTLLPLLFFAAFYRNFAVSVLQARYQIEKIFWIDTVYFLGVLVLLALFQKMGRFHGAGDVLHLSIMMLACSSLVALALTRRELTVRLTFRREAFSRMWQLGKYVFGGSAMIVLFSQLDVFFISSWVGIVATATYNAAKVLNRLFDILSQVIQFFLVPFSSKTYVQRDIEKLVIVAEKTICFSTLLVLPLVCIMLLFPEQLLHILYKGKYDEGAAIVRVLSVFALMVPWNAVIASYLVGTGKVKQGFYSGIMLVVLALSFYWIFTPLWGSLGTCVGLTLAFVLVTLGLVRYIQTVIPLRMVGVLKRTADVWVFLQTKWSVR